MRNYFQQNSSHNPTPGCGHGIPQVLAILKILFRKHGPGKIEEYVHVYATYLLLDFLVLLMIFGHEPYGVDHSSSSESWWLPTENAIKADWRSNEGNLASIGEVVELNGDNYRKWRDDVEFYMAMHQNIDYCMLNDKPEKELDDNSTEDEIWHYHEWFRTNRMAKNVIRRTMFEVVKGSIEETADAVDYMAAVAEMYEESEKAEGARLHKEMLQLRYDGTGSVREHIMHKVHLNDKLRQLRMGVSDAQLVHNALFSLPASFSNLRSTYNALENKWTVSKLISICVDEERTIRQEAGPSTTVNLVEKPKWKKKNNHKVKQTTNIKTSGKPAESKSDKSLKLKCFFCKKMGHFKECPGFKTWMIKKGFNKEEGSQSK